MINIVFSCRKDAMISIKPLIKSIQMNTTEKINFYLLTDDDISAQNLDIQNLEIKKFRIPEKLKEYVTNENNIMSYAKFYLSSIFQNLNKIIYMDVDMICLGNIQELYKIVDWNNHIFGACVDSLGWSCLAESNTFVDKTKNTFDAGLFITSLNAWREENIEEQFEQWMIRNKENDYGLFTDDIKAIMNLVFYDRFCKFPIEWNYDIGDYDYDEEYIGSLKILHYVGVAKPWNHLSGCKNTRWWYFYYTHN